MPFSVRRFCVDLRTTMCLAFKKKPGVRIHLACDKAVEDLILLGSPRHLRCVLRNLMANAIKFTPAGFVRLAAHVVREVPESATLRFVVEDTGIGIEPADQAAIFREFKQVGCKVGTGLGLPLSHGVVALMGGTPLAVVSPWAAPAPPAQIVGPARRRRGGAGSMFHFQIALRKATQSQRAEVEAELASDGALGGDPTQPDGSRRPPLPTMWRCLVADDHEINRRLLHRKLRAICGAWSIERAETGEAALKKCKRARFDLILLDEQFGTGLQKGTEITRKIRAHEAAHGPSTVRGAFSHVGAEAHSL